MDAAKNDGETKALTARKVGINKNIVWHTFRHSFGTILKANGEDVKTVQELLRHANSRITLDVYTRRSHRKPSLTLGRLEDLFRTFVLEVYHRRASSEVWLAPSERWEEGVCPTTDRGQQRNEKE
jgi:hypothetical protein